MRTLLRLASALVATALVACVPTPPDFDFDRDPSPEDSWWEPADPPGGRRTEPPVIASPDPSFEPEPDPSFEPEPEPEPGDDPSFPEVVYVFMTDHGFGRWMCTGTLLSRKTVITAAHCLDPEFFASYQIVAPNAPGRPRVSASKPKILGGTFEDVANPDLGILTLDTPIDLPGYAVPTDVVASVDAGEPVAVAALVRIDQKAEAPLAWTPPMPLSSTVAYGYEHGFGTPMFSKGGDSGAGLFLVEGGVRTHKLVGVARQPEPARGLDHFTRVDAALLDWLAANASP